jgi:preprotein translocase subunit SecA
MSIFTRVLRSGEGRKLKALEALVPDINALESEFEALSDDALRAKTGEFRGRLDQGEAVDDLLIESFATIREAAKRVLGQRHYDVQLVGGAALHLGWVAEMKTGEGKTLTSTLPIYLNGVTGKGVHVVTVNDYLASRDAEWMGQVHRWMGLEVGLVLPGSRDSAFKHAQYGADITYGTNNEFGFDYLRDNMAMSREKQVQRGHHYCIVDEIDSILIDEARTPLIISGKVADAAQLYVKFASIARGLQRDVHYEVDEEKRTVAPLEEGVHAVERALGVDNLYDQVSANLVHQLQAALRAKELYRKDRDYLVDGGGAVKIIDEFTGRVMEGRRWSDGIHQAIEAKEGVSVKEENQTLATITLQNYYRLYDRLAGMTGTAETEASEFVATYGLHVVPVPTNKPLARLDEGDLIYKTEEAKFNACIDDIVERSAKGQPVLVGTVSVEKSEVLSRMMEKRGVIHEVLNAKQHHREAEIVTQAGVSVRSPSQPTWPVVVSTSCSAAIPRGLPTAMSAPKDSTPMSKTVGPALRNSSPNTKPPPTPNGKRFCRSAASTCLVPSATRAVASTTSCVAAPVVKAIPARADSTCRSKTISCASSPPER